MQGGTIEVWGRQTSINVQKVLWTAAELGFQVTRHDVGRAFGGVATPAYAKLNPNNLVPVLRDGDLVLWESNAICRYLAGKKGDETFWPNDPARRARADCWFDWASTTLGAPFGVLFASLVRKRADARDQAALAQAEAAVAHCFRMLDAHLAGRRFIVGENFTAAEIAPGAAAYRWLGLTVERPHLPHLEAWYNRLCARPAYRRNVMIPII